jgi:hypothetical protein
MNQNQNKDNVINLLITALKFYQNEDNYKKTFDNELSLIDKDGGHQARFALKTVDDIIKLEEKSYNEYENIIKTEDVDSDVNDFLSKINKFIENN